MPISVDTNGASARAGAPSTTGRGRPRLRLRLTPHKSLTPQGFVWFIGVTAALISLPLFSILGTGVFWALLPFILAAIAGIWWALQRSWRAMDVYEDLILWDDLVRLERHEPKGSRDWEANPHWVRPVLHTKGGPVPNYLTLQGGEREVELGAFLTPPERVELRDTLERELRAS